MCVGIFFLEWCINGWEEKGELKQGKKKRNEMKCRARYKRQSFPPSNYVRYERQSQYSCTYIHVYIHQLYDAGASLVSATGAVAPFKKASSPSFRAAP